MLINIWTKKFMLRPVAHCNSGCILKFWIVNFEYWIITLCQMEKVIYLSLVTASISFTVTETKLFEPIRNWLNKKFPLLGKLFNCGYCFGHWIAFGLVLIYQPRLFYYWFLLDYFLTALVIAWLAGFQWALMFLLMQKTGK